MYKQVHAQFKDTFEILKKERAHFGVPDYMENKIDEAVFFNKDSTQCFFIVLQRTKDSVHVFGGARIVYGKLGREKWLFKPEMSKSFAKDYFELYKENSFENISKLARYSVLTDGKVKRGGCEIDEYYWFVHLKQ